MAIVWDNTLTSGLRGKFGHLSVFRSMRGKTFVSRAPGKQDKCKETQAQRSTRVTFAEASRWAKTVLLNEEKKIYYQQLAREWKLPNAYTAAIKEFMCKREGRITCPQDNNV